MEARDYSSHVVATSSTTNSYPSPAILSPHLSQPENLTQHLPPIAQQNNHHAMQQMYGNGHPRTPATPNTPTPNMGGYSQPTSQPGIRAPMYAMAQQSQYPNPPHGYGASSSMLPQSASGSHPQPIAPAPAPGRAAPVLRPMPAQGVMGQMSGAVMQQGVPDGEPTHVVGSQGRRGILPSAPGRPQVGAKGPLSLEKDADGKFPCPHCTKTYLHAKHLKRHLLRHTGDRPYRCVLCNDTFSRSDILKRHFQKCSIRRGNPTGASHLSHPQAHVKKSQQQQKPPPPLGGEGDMNHLNGMNSLQGDGMVHPFGIVPVPDGSNNLNRLDNGAGQDRRNMSGPVLGNGGRPGYDQPYGADVGGQMAGQQVPAYGMPQNQNGMPMYGSGPAGNQQSGLEWSMFQTGAQDTYANTFTPNIGQTQIGTKQEPSVDSGRTDGLPAVALTESLFFAPNLNLTAHDPYQLLSNQILDFFYPPGALITNQSAGLNLYFSPENIKDFLDKYTHFHIHFPMIHIPTFRIMDAYTGLLVGLCCIGACYSDRVESSHVREMMDFAKVALERDSQLIASAQDPGPLERPVTPRDVEEIQALMLSFMLHTWNGTPQQRESSRQTYLVLASLAKKTGLLQVSVDSSLYSPLHQQTFSLPGFDPATFDWEAWVEQERRIRLGHIIVLGDVAMGLYFNMASHFNSLDITLPLPSDDGAWDARNARDCAMALGLYGPAAAAEKNFDGTQRPKQPELNLVLGALIHSSYQIQPGSTNLYGKFILVHHILALIRKAVVDQNTSILTDVGTPPLSDWMVRGGDTANSGRATPVDGAGQQIPPQTEKALSTALDKFKSNWDVDMATQFPPSLSTNPRRQGFSRDGIHFYCLARYMLRHTRIADLQVPPEVRFRQVMQLLKSVNKWVMSDGALRGEELGSVGDIDKDYGAMDLTLDMARLFKPLPALVDDPENRIPSVKTDI